MTSQSTYDLLSLKQCAGIELESPRLDSSRWYSIQEWYLLDASSGTGIWLRFLGGSPTYVIGSSRSFPSLLSYLFPWLSRVSKPLIHVGCCSFIPWLLCQHQLRPVIQAGPGLVLSKGIGCEWCGWFRNSSMWLSYSCCHVLHLLLQRPGLSVSMRRASITHDLCAKGVCRHIGWSLAKGLGLYLQVVVSLRLIHNPLFSDWQGSFKDPRPVTPIWWAVLLRLSLHSVFVCHKRGPMVGNTMCSIGPEVRIGENRLWHWYSCQAVLLPYGELISN